MIKKLNPERAWLLIGVLSALLGSVTLTGCGGEDDDDEGERSGVVQPRERDD